MKRLALCIGNNEYTILPKLRFAVKDAVEVSEALSKLGFETICRCDLNRREMVDVIGEFVDKLADYDSCVFYYAGHGCQIEGENILEPVDLNDKDRPLSMKQNAYPLEDLMRSLDKYPKKTKVFIFDACRTAINGRGALKGFAPVLAPQGSIIAFATSPGQSSGEHDSIEHGAYTGMLLKYINLPRVNIESVFKKTREQMVALYGPTQIPWEHTSLIGDYYLNPNTIYDGVNYSPEALADKRFVSRDSTVKKVVEGLKSYNWYSQGDALLLISEIDFDSVLASDLFVIGRNIYQAACGHCFDAQVFIDGFAEKNINEMAKLHMLNGMAYEIYFDSSNICRIHPKTGYYSNIIQLIEKDEFFGSKSFITSALVKTDNKVFYIPGQNEKMEFTIEKDINNNLKAILYKGNNVLLGEDGEKYDAALCTVIEKSSEQLKKEIATEVVAPIDYISFTGDDIEKIHTPIKITIGKKTTKNEDD